MTWLPDDEKISKISLFVLTQLTNVTDTQTDRQTDGQTPQDSTGRAYASHRAAKTMYQYCTEKMTKVDCSDIWGNIYVPRPGRAGSVFRLDRGLMYFAAIALRASQPFAQNHDLRMAVLWTLP